MILRTPLVPMPGADRVWLKLENLQPIGSFKIRGASCAIDRLSPEQRAQGVVTASAGNMAQGVALAAKRYGVTATIIAPDTAPKTKLEAIARLGGRIISVPFDRWWKTLEDRAYPGVTGAFIHPVEDDDVMAGNGTIANEILEDLPDVEQILVPWGGGGLSCGIARALEARGAKARVRVIACEVATAAPLTASFAAGRATSIDRIPSFVDGIGGKSVLPRMFDLARRHVDGTIVAPLDEVKAAVRLLLERVRIVAEGAGATPIACLRQALPKKTVCIVSGGNIDLSVLREFLGSATD
ncbi:MAG: threonine/serine dehydratase [Planctomycetes bacterium]|nr:threonine/serine dehydratase [Planctomycetota bacterium]